MNFAIKQIRGTVYHLAFNGWFYQLLGLVCLRETFSHLADPETKDVIQYFRHTRRLLLGGVLQVNYLLNERG